MPQNFHMQHTFPLNIHEVSKVTLPRGGPYDYYLDTIQHGNKSYSVITYLSQIWIQYLISWDANPTIRPSDKNMFLDILSSSDRNSWSHIFKCMLISFLFCLTAGFVTKHRWTKQILICFTLFCRSTILSCAVLTSGI